MPGEYKDRLYGLGLAPTEADDINANQLEGNLLSHLAGLSHLARLSLVAPELAQFFFESRIDAPLHYLTAKPSLLDLEWCRIA